MLLRLPAGSLFRFRTVCKTWRRTIDDPSFFRSHADHQKSSSTLLIRTAPGTPIYEISLDSLDYSDGQQIIDATRVKTLIHTGVPRLPILPVASCRGLILISATRKIWVIWNPLTREFEDLPEFDVNGFLMGSGLGYDSAADDYKVVRIEQVLRTDLRPVGQRLVCRTHVYTRKLDSWKMIKDCPCDFPEKDAGVFLNGALYWRSYEMMIELDLGTEEYYEFPLPPHDPSWPISEMHFGAMSGSLMMSCSRSIWVFDRVDKLWNKLFSYENLYIGCNPRPIAYLERKGQVVLQGWGSRTFFYWLDIEKNTAKKFTIDSDELPDHFTCQICPGSLFRLGYSCDGEKSGGTKRKRSQRKSDRRLKWSVRICDSRCRLDTTYGYQL